MTFCLKQKTVYEMRISDWSSDVCSSDLKLGRRRSWLVLSQALVILGLIGMGFCDPQKHLSWLIAIAVIVAFASATQDIAVDAYHLEIADATRSEERRVGEECVSTSSTGWPAVTYKQTLLNRSNIK